MLEKKTPYRGKRLPNQVLSFDWEVDLDLPEGGKVRASAQEADGNRETNAHVVDVPAASLE